LRSQVIVIEGAFVLKTLTTRLFESIFRLSRSGK
jgi:hypothetical protein